MVIRTLSLTSFLLLSACATLSQIPEESGRSAGVGNAIVIGDETFEPSRGSVLSIIQSRVRGMTVTRTEICPRIIVRGGGSRSQVADAVVYVNGQRISDTCILEGLDVEAVSSVEVYPSGVTQRPGYHSNSGGLILVFMKDGSDARVW